MGEEIKRYKRELAKKTVFTALAVFLFLFLLDRVIKYYDMYAAKKAGSANPIEAEFLTEQQMAEYRKATELVPYPYLMLVARPNFHSDTININSHGLRGPEIKPKALGITRIVIVGGSGAMGYGASSDNTTFTARLENKLNASGTGNKTYEVINAGLPSAIAMQEFILISTKVISLAPDMVIVFDGFNDMVGSVINDRRPGYPWRFSDFEKALNISVTKAFIRKRLMNYRPTKKILEYIEKKKMKDMKKRQDYSLNPASLDFYGVTLDRIAHILKSYDIKPVFAYQPSVYFKKPRTALENAILEKESKNRVEILETMLAMGKNAMQETAEKNGALFINCLPVFNGLDEDIFFDPVHFADRGQEILAQFLFEKLKEGGNI